MSPSLRERPLVVGLLGASLLLVGLAAPASAAASNISEILGLDSEAPAEFSAKAAKGYSIEVRGSGNEVTLSAKGPEGSAAVYSAPGRTSTAGMTASFGKLGRVDVEFTPSRRTRVEMPPNRCKGKPRVTRWGIFAGTIRFAGEHGYTRLRESRVPGRTHLVPRWRCRGPRGAGSGQTGAGKPPSLPGETSEDAAVLEVTNGSTGVETGAFSFRPPEKQGLTLFVAGVQEQRKRLLVSRYAFESGADQAFEVDESLTAATVAPPEPFAGSAIFQRNADGSVSWSGSLTVVLPGTARIPLTGPDWRPRLYRPGEGGIANPAF